MLLSNPKNNMKKLYEILSLITALAVPVAGFCQQVISTAGSSGSGTGIELSWTIGEPVTATSHGTDFYLTQGFHQSQMVSAIYIQDLSFSTGWNIMSVRVIPQNKNLLNIFQPLIDAGFLKKIMDEAGNSLEDWGVFGGWQNNIGEINPSSGYKVKVNSNSNLMVSGNPVLLPYSIPLKTGWNIMGYPNQISFDAMNVLQPLIDNGSLVKVQDESGNSLEDWGIFGGWTNNIGNFNTGEGYKIKLKADDTLRINESYPKSLAVFTEMVSTNHFIPQYVGNGVDHMNINLVDLPLNLIKPGDELAVFDGKTCAGAVTLLPKHLRNHSVSIIASANDEEEMAGFTEGNPIIYKLWISGSNKEYTFEPEIVSGNSTFAKLETTIASLDKYTRTGLDGIQNSVSDLINVYPNPFSEDLTVEINLANDTEVEIVVLNQLGQKIKILTDKKLFNKGTHYFSWHSKSASVPQISTGIYYINILLDNEIHFKKVVFSKTGQ